MVTRLTIKTTEEWNSEDPAVQLYKYMLITELANFFPTSRVLF